MYRTSQYRIKRGHKLYEYCQNICCGVTSLYSRANYIMRQYATAVWAMEEYKPLFPNQMEVFRMVRSFLEGTKYMPSGKWFSYGAMDYLLKVTEDSIYFGLPAQVNQQTLKLLLRDYRSFFEAQKAYKRDPACFTGRPGLPGYPREDSCKTAIFTNQNVKIMDGHYLKFPNTKIRLNLGKDLCSSMQDARIKETHIKLCGPAFAVEVVWELPGRITCTNEINDKTDMSKLRILSIDPGLDNLCAITNNFGEKPILIKGNHAKYLNQWYNKRKAELSSIAQICNHRYTTRQIQTITDKRNRQIKDFFHKVSRHIANYALCHHVDMVVMGHNVFQKQDITIGHVNNQNFVQIPFTVLTDMLRYKLNACGISFVTTEESYTSKADFLAMDEIPVFQKGDNTDYVFSGIRKGRLYQHFNGKISNADINGAANILRKVAPKVRQWESGVVDTPCAVKWHNGCFTDSCRVTGMPEIIVL